MNIYGHLSLDRKVIVGDDVSDAVISKLLLHTHLCELLFTSKNTGYNDHCFQDNNLVYKAFYIN